MSSPDSAVPSVPMTLADFTGPGLMVPHLRGGEAASAIQELTGALHAGNRVPDALPFYEAALNREFLASTDMEAGMAFPHARLGGLKEVSFALGRSDEPLRWGSQAANPVRLVFLMAFPATDATHSLRVISALARLSKDPVRVAGLLAARDGAAMFEVLQQVGLRSPPRDGAAGRGT